MATASYHQFCPVAMASEVLCTRWTILILRELVSGTTRFNDMRRGLPRLSPALLSQRLKELEEAGVLERVPARREPGVFEYRLTQAGLELEPIVMAFGAWGQRWIEKDVSLQHLDAQLLMWDMRRHLNVDPLPDRKCVISFTYPDQSASARSWWLIVEPGVEVDLCSVDPGFDVDLFVSTDLRTMTAIWMGHQTVNRAVAANELYLTGDRKLASHMQTWLGLSPMTRVERKAS